MQGLKSVWKWVKKWWAALVIGVVVLAGSLFWANRRRVGRLVDELAVERAKNEIEGLKKVRARLLEEGEEASEEIQSIDNEIKANKRAIIEAHENSEGLSDDEVEAELTRLGY